MFLYKLIVPLLLFVAIATSCGQITPTNSNSAAAQGGSVEPVLAFSETTVGRNRIALGLIHNGTPVNDPGAKVHVRFYDLEDTNPKPQGDSDAKYYGQGLPIGYYVTYSTLDKPGNWGIEIEAQLTGQAQPSRSRFQLEVKPKSDVPNIGDHAISVKTLTVKDVSDPAQLASTSKPDPAMYQISLDQALQSGKPTALLFATPGFCQTATCGPSLQVMEGLQKRYGDKINFIHVEVYKYPFAESFQKITQLANQARKENRGLTPEEQRSGYAEPMLAWGLVTEPWLYLIDTKGIIAARFEGGITQEEIGPALDNLIAGKPIL